MHFREYIKAVDDCIEAVFKSLRGWDENHISYSICEALQSRLRNRNIEGLGTPISISWDAFKQKGALERHHGDIAVLVRYAKQDGEDPLSGVGFLEAKVAYPKSGRYEAIDWSQLERISNTTRYSMLLLYNSSEIRGYGDNVAFQQFSASEEINSYANLSSHACTLQTVTALRVRATDQRLHDHVIPLSHQVCNRYLRFMDLDTDMATVNKALGWIEKEGGARFLLVATIKIGALAMPPLNINSEVYERIGEDKKFGPDGGTGGGKPGAPSLKPIDGATVKRETKLAEA